MPVSKNLPRADAFNDAPTLPFNLRVQDFALAMQDVYDFFYDVNVHLVAKGLARLDEMLRPAIMSGMLSDMLTASLAKHSRSLTVNAWFNGHPDLLVKGRYPNDSVRAGEDGVEIAVPVERAADVWRMVTSVGIEPAGLGARDTLRLEAGLPLHGHELGAGITTLNAGLGWVVSWTKGPFRGREALDAQRETGVEPVLVGIRTEGKRPPRAEMPVLRGGAEVGRVSSGNYSPMLDCGVALAFVDASVATGDAVTLVGRGNELAGTVVDLPFVRSPR